MTVDLLNMSDQDLDKLDGEASKELDRRLREMRYDEELNELFEKVEEIRKEKQRRGI